MTDYKLCSLEELAKHFLTSPRSRYSQQLNHYRKSGNDEMVAKIEKAKLMMKVMKMQEKIELMG